MGALETLLASYGFAFGAWQGNAVTDAMLNRFASGLAGDGEAKALIDYLYQNREKNGYRAKPTGKDLEAALHSMRRDRGELPAAGGCPECDGCGVVLVAAHKVADKWVIGWHPEARLTTCPCVCPRGRELWRKDAFEGQYMTAREWLDGQRVEAQAAKCSLITWLTRQENALAAARRRAGDIPTASAAPPPPASTVKDIPTPAAESDEIPVDIPAEGDRLSSERDADGLTPAEARAMTQAELCGDDEGPDPASIPF